MIICHRFYSTGWWAHLGKHISTELTEDTFDKVVTLKVSRGQKGVAIPSNNIGTQTGHCLIFSPTALVAKADTCAPDIGRLSLYDSATVRPGGIWGVEEKPKKDGWLAVDKGKGKGKATDSGSHGFPSQRPSSWDTPTEVASSSGWGGTSTNNEYVGTPTESSSGWGASASHNDGNIAGPAESCSGWGVVKTSNDGWGKSGGWGGASGEDGVRPGSSSSGRTEFWDPEEEVSRPVTQEGNRVNVKNGLPPPVNSFSYSTPQRDAPPIHSSSLENFAPRSKDEGERKREVEHLGRGYMAVKTRRRVTVDGGRSLLATESSNREPESQGQFRSHKHNASVIDNAPLEQDGELDAGYCRAVRLPNRNA
jgi:hypothetical protein